MNACDETSFGNGSQEIILNCYFTGDKVFKDEYRQSKVEVFFDPVFFSVLYSLYILAIFAKHIFLNAICHMELAVCMHYYGNHLCIEDVSPQ
mgnify:CR=1 FL=1